jgi:dCMP deaminase
MRPDWSDYYLGLAKVVSRRSHDKHTKHGCIITNQDNMVLGQGYNGFPHGLDDKNLPLDRPDKYPWMIHAERNALSNCTVRPANGIAYVTGQSCTSCIMSLWQEGIKKVVMIDDHGTKLFDEESQKIFDTFVKMSGIVVYKTTPNLSWLKDLCGVL